MDNQYLSVYTHAFNAVSKTVCEREPVPEMKRLSVLVSILSSDGSTISSHVIVDLTKPVMPQLTTKAQIVDEEIDDPK